MWVSVLSDLGFTTLFISYTGYRAPKCYGDVLKIGNNVKGTVAPVLKYRNSICLGDRRTPTPDTAVFIMWVGIAGDAITGQCDIHVLLEDVPH